ncbi:MAG TPA: rod shape-determining protein MreC [Firmicutes bacterium]|nr:rod shape-determining protein MreC [Bacillota bacterium]
MRREVFTNRKVLGGVFVILALISLSFVTSRDRTRLTSAECILRDALSPVISFVAESTRGCRDAIGALLHAGSLRAENEELRMELARLQAEILQLKEYQRENERLRKLLDFDAQAPYKMMAARVIGRDPANWLSVLIINKGKKNGIQRNMAVVTFEGLVGRIISVTNTTATVLLITDPKSAVGGVLDRSRDLVLVEGQTMDPGLLSVKALTSDVDIRVGDSVISSGYGGIFPKGIMIGRISSISEGKYRVSKRAVAEPAVDFARLEEVLVITGK